MYIGSIDRQRYIYEQRNLRRVAALGALLCAVAFGVGGFTLAAFSGPLGYTGSIIEQEKLMNEIDLAVEEKLPAASDGEGGAELGLNTSLQPTAGSISENVKTEMVNTEAVSAEAMDAATNTGLILTDPNIDLVVIDPGHGGEDEGCERDGVFEKDINLQLALALRDQLMERGIEVVLTRDADLAVSLEERIEIANTSGADILVSIHQNAYEGRDASGMETWYSSAASGKDSSRLASLLHKYMLQATEAGDRGIVEDEELKVIREAKMPACLVETGFLSNPRERALLTDEEYQTQIVEGLANGIEYYFRPKTMYLTFDDGPSAENTSAILDTLKEKNIKATFFLIGENVSKHPEVAKRIAAEGHTIGIHCNNHDYNKLYESVDSFVADFEAAYDTIYEVTGVEVEIFRFPGGSINAHNKEVYEDIIGEMTERGFVYYDWNASLEDAVKKPEPQQLLKNAKESTLGRKKVVMLAHDIVYSTALCLEELIEQFPEYKMEPLTKEVSPIQF